MIDNSLMEKLAAASAAQDHASDPSGSRFASANAGSGKTHVLVNRVSRLLISGVAPDHILCLTYTKAAASEMQTRLFQKLGTWSVLPEAALDKELAKLFARPDHGIALTTARALFAKALETPGGLKVQTIHAFCEFVLSRFPIEVGLLPGFDTLQDEERLELLKSTEIQLLEMARDNPDGDIAKAFRFFAAQAADRTLQEYFNWMGHNIYAIGRWESADGLVQLAGDLKLAPNTTPQDIYAQSWMETDQAKLRELCPNLINNSADTNQRVGAALDKALICEDPAEAFKLYSDIFFTKIGRLRASVVTGKAEDAAQSFLGAKAYMPTDEITRVLGQIQKIKSAELLQATSAFYALAVPFAKYFSKAKDARRRVSFDDQVERVRQLLTRSEVADWVGYKLDGGISHILVDEAQDTPPMQWDILDALHHNFDPSLRHEATGLAKTFFAVGDEKQSIYSFQGARPDVFLAKTQSHDDGVNFKAPRMRTSFRSTPQVLELVDQIFVDGGGAQRMFDAANFAPAGDLIRHVAIREDQGYVELWPLSPYERDDSPELAGDLRPLDEVSAADSREVLAAKIAAEIKIWLDKGRPIYDRELKALRPIRAGDVMILVQKRGPLYKALLRHLKIAHVPVVGPDRLKLKDALAVQDLLTLAGFILQPGDDLALAELLKGPFFGWDDDQIFDLAYDRKGDLWAQLNAAETAHAHHALSVLKRAVSRASYLAPYEFFARFLDDVDQDGISHWTRIYRRLSMETKDAVQSFLARALAHQRQGVPSLQDFTASFRYDETELKRELDNVQDQVRIMTVHGAKGLEAPIVILPDASDPPRTSDRKQPVQPYKSGFVFAGSSTKGLYLADEIFENQSALEQQEYLRRLYVALTRAETELIICGYERGKSTKLTTWYDDVKAALERLGGPPCTGPLGEGLCYGQRPTGLTTQTHSPALQTHDLPAFLKQAAPELKPSLHRVTPSHMIGGHDADPMDPARHAAPMRSPLTDTPDRFRRGILIHKLLEFLPDVDSARQNHVAAQFLLAHEDLSPLQKSDIIDTVFGVLTHPEYKDFFAAGSGGKLIESRAEVSISGTAKSLPDKMVVSGQIDRLCIYTDRILILDYKSNRPPPKHESDVAPLYMMQMASYAALMKEAYPEHKIECALLWTDGPRLMTLSESSIVAALTRINRLPN